MACVPFLHFSTSSLHRVVLSSDPRHSASVGHSVPSKNNSANQGLLRIFTLTVLGFMGELPLDYYHSQIGRLSWIYNILIIRLIMLIPQHQYSGQNLRTDVQFLHVKHM